jgi:hypothetical protein
VTLVVVAFWAAFAAGAVLLVAAFVSMPSGLVAAAFIALATSAVAILVATGAAARRDGVSYPRAMLRGAEGAFRWLFWFLP